MNLWETWFSYRKRRKWNNVILSSSGILWTNDKKLRRNGRPAYVYHKLDVGMEEKERKRLRVNERAEVWEILYSYPHPHRRGVNTYIDVCYFSVCVCVLMYVYNRHKQTGMARQTVHPSVRCCRKLRCNEKHNLDSHWVEPIVFRKCDEAIDEQAFSWYRFLNKSAKGVIF